MRNRSNTPPPGAFTLEPMPGHPGMARIRFFENAEHITEQTHWEYDEYNLVVRERPGLEADVMVSYDTLMERAKAAECEYTDEDLAESSD